MTERLRLDRRGLSLGVVAVVVLLVGATTVIVSLGILRTIPQLGVLMLAVVLLTIQGFIINRAAGIDYRLWAPRQT
jgi:hypothetical protein